MDQQIRAALHEAVTAHRNNDTEKAERIYKEILTLDRSQPDANHNLGLISLSLNNIEEAVLLFKTALQAMPRVEQYRASYVDALIQNDELNMVADVISEGRTIGISETALTRWESQMAAKERFNSQTNRSQLQSERDQQRNSENATSDQPQKPRSYGPTVGAESVPAQADLDAILILYQKGHFKEAASNAKTITQKFPRHSYAWQILGAILNETGDYKGALNAHRQATELAAEDPTALNNLGFTLQKLGRFMEARQTLESAVSLAPDSPQILFNLGIAFQSLGDSEKAKHVYQRVIKIDPTNIGAIANLGNVQRAQGDIKRAEDTYRKAISIDPSIDDVRLNLIDLLEKANLYEDAAEAIEEAHVALDVIHSDFRYYEALIQFRRNHYEKADQTILNIPEEEISQTRKASFYQLKAKLYEYKKDFPAAFEHFQLMNKHIKNSNAFSAEEAQNYLDGAKRKAAELIAARQYVREPVESNPEIEKLIFLIGFPRSGTTLLDSILRSHSKIDVVEEGSMVSHVTQSFSKPPNLAEIEALSEAKVEKCRQIYFQQLKNYTQGREVRIDKLPLNIIELPLIANVFPEANFLLAIRHPMDCVLSCWMQNFDLNPAVSNMVELDRTVDLYCAAMEIFQACKQRYSLRVHQSRYEDLVANFEAEVSAILDSFKLEWEGQVKDYQKTAASRSRINTPSYSQVIRPIYTAATNRWINYESLTIDSQRRLQPWIQEFGY